MNIKKYNKHPYYISCIVALGLMSIMFYNLGVNHAQEDFPLHNSAALELFELAPSEMAIPHILAYPLMHATIKILSYLIYFPFSGSITALYSVEIASVIVATVFNMLSIFAVRLVLNGLFPQKSPAIRYIYDFLSISSVFIMGICGPLTYNEFYLPQGGPNVWHNPTFIFVRPFGLMSFYFFIKAFEALKSGKPYVKNLCLFSFVLILSCFAKPNYAFVLMPAMGILTLIELSNNFIPKFKKIAVPLFLSVLPAGFVLIAQFVFINATLTDKNVYTLVQFGTQYNLPFEHSLRATVSLLIIPLIIFIIIGRKYIKKDSAYTLSILTVLAGWFQYFFLYQTGAAGGDYFWGYGLAVHLAILISIAFLLKQKADKLIVNSVCVLYLLHLFFGLQYFIGLFYGARFISYSLYLYAK